ncbi:MAG: Mn-dependent transcriptional regulator MntR [Cytophagales bacterium]|jgi:DtxR family Mn-dependent transcriptional regulator|nr:metal-dependent transcriptional regulator [Bacteroidota bacterium]MBS1981980.1 metal-dependent transcriptional regulator [Bacteroidota bacterium]WHZ09432.1 MAG: Mn-dependent transcriptional regulator MntR [Cytophagales bacterium]
MLSFTEENYLKAIYHLSQDGDSPVLTNDLAKSVKTKAASATDMIRKLASKKLIGYKKYYGATLTAKGKAAALMVIRKHRLWETFLVQKLGFLWSEVHEVAEQLEHIQSRRLIERLDEFLDFPRTDPHGDPIPDQNGKIFQPAAISCDQLKEGKPSSIIAVKDSSNSLLMLLDKIGAHPGKKIKIIGREPFDQSLEVLLDGQKVFLSSEVAKNILVKE